MNTVLTEQSALAHDLHSDLHATLELYDAVRDGTDELNVSHTEQIRLTKSLGEAVQLAGKPLEQAGGVMAKFSFALASGKIETRELKGIMREVPEVADLWTKHFNTSRQGLMTLVSSGKIAVEDLALAMVQDTKTLDDNFKKRESTNAQRREEWILNEKILSQQRDVSIGSGHSADAAYRLGFGLDPSKVLKENWQSFVTTVNDTSGQLSTQLARVGESIDREIVKSIKQATEAFPVMIDEFTKGLSSIARGVGLQADPWGSDKTGFAAQLTLLTSIKNPINDAKQSLDNLNGLMAKGAINAEEYRKHYDDLMTTINDGRLPEAIRIWESLREPQLAFNRGTQALDLLLNSGRVTIEQYHAELRKLSNTFAGPEMTSLLDFSARAIKPGSQANAFARFQADVAHEGIIGDKQAAIDRQYQIPDGPDLAADLAALDRRTEILRAQGKEITGLDEAIRTHNEQLRLEAGYTEAIRGPQEQYQNRIAAINDLVHNGTMNAEQYNRAVDGARAAYLAASEEGRTFTGAMEASWLKLKADAESFGQTVSTQLLGDLDKLNDALVTAANGGEVAWAKMADAMIADLERILIKQIEVLAITALLNAIAPGSGTAASSAGVTGAVVAQLPHAATGGQWVVGGAGGTDSQLAQIRVTPGETITVQTPEQRRAEAGGGARGSGAGGSSSASTASRSRRRRHPRSSRP